MFEKIRRRVCILLAMILILTTQASIVLAKGTKIESGHEITYEELPDEFKNLVRKDARIEIDENGDYVVCQEPKQDGISTYAAERHAPDGGTYSNFSNASFQGSKIQYLVYQTYIPRTKTCEWLIENTPDLKSTMIDWAKVYTVSKVIELVAKSFGITLNADAVNFVISGGYFVISNLNYNQVKSASDNGKEAIVIYYVTGGSIGNLKIYEPWYNEPYVPLYPNGGVADWANGKYSVSF